MSSRDAWRRIHFDGLALGFGFAAKAAGQTGSQHHMTDVLVTDAANLTDFGAIVVRLGERTDLVAVVVSPLVISAADGRASILLLTSPESNEF